MNNSDDSRYSPPNEEQNSDDKGDQPRSRQAETPSHNATPTRKGHMDANNLPTLAPIAFASRAINATSQNYGAAVGGGATPHVANSAGSGLIIAPSIDEEDSLEEVSLCVSYYVLCHKMSNCNVTFFHVCTIPMYSLKFLQNCFICRMVSTLFMLMCGASFT